MKIIPLINEFTNTFNETFKNNLNPLNIESKIRNIGDSYIRNDLINDFKVLVNIQTKNYPEQEKYMLEHMKYIINNLDGIKRL